MTIFLERRDDGSSALYLDGDLQFDSRDEAIYHEALALPALALAESRYRRPLSALICGGGDGLIARELLKSSRLTHVDLVDSSPEVLELAREALHDVNLGSLRDRRMQIHVEDAWSFAEKAAASRRRYDLIVSDLTVPQDEAGARMHGAEWYGILGSILASRGILATNAISPSSAPDAYWCIYNTLRANRLHPRAYRVAIPSFAAAGYGPDWGFFLASPRTIRGVEVESLKLANPRREIKSLTQLRRLFLFPSEGAGRRSSIPPVKGQCSLLLQLIYGTASPVSVAGRSWDSLSFARDRACLLPADGSSYILPAKVRNALAEACAESDQAATLEQLLASMPTLNRYQTGEMVSAFVEQPSRFLTALDIRSLIERLLRRAAELPGWFVDELRLLGSSLTSSAGDGQSLLNLGMRVVTIVSLVIIVGNLLFPDSVYGKGTSGAGASSHISSVSSMAHTSSGFVSSPPSTVQSSGFRSRSIGRDVTVDEIGSVLPSRTYRYYGYYDYDHWSHDIYQPAYAAQNQQVNQSGAFYRLTPETDILEDGRVAINVSEDAYLLLGQEASTLVDSKSGRPILALRKDPTLVWRMAQEIERQRSGLDKSVGNKVDWMEWLNWIQFAPFRGDDEAELANLRATRERLSAALVKMGQTQPAPQSSTPPPATVPPVKDAVQAFSGVWLPSLGNYLVLELADGRKAYMDATSWYQDADRKQPMAEPYPQEFKRVIKAYLDERVKGADAERSRLVQTMSDLDTNLMMLQMDKTEYEGLRTSGTGLDDSVEYGAQDVPLREAIRLTDEDIASTQAEKTLVTDQVSKLPAETSAAKLALQMLGGSS